jgi:hypothetical protein
MARQSLCDARWLCRLPDGLAIREEIEDLTPEPVVTDTSFLDDAVLEPVVDDGQKALPSPSEKPLPGSVIEENKPKEAVEAPGPQGTAGEVIQVRVSITETHEPSKGQAPNARNPKSKNARTQKRPKSR